MADEARLKSYDFASEVSKQLITLSTAILGLSITFSKDVVGAVPVPAGAIMLAAWIAYLLSILMGVITLMNLTGRLHFRACAEDQARPGVAQPPAEAGAAEAVGEQAHPVEQKGVDTNTDVYYPPVRVAAAAQSLFFLLATTLVVAAGAVAMLGPRPPAEAASAGKPPLVAAPAPPIGPPVSPPLRTPSIRARPSHVP